jgi:hypothetical protein
MRGLVAVVCGATLIGPPLFAVQGAASKTIRGLEISAAGIEHAAKASLRDCPPGENTVGSTAKPGEEFAIVSLTFKMLPAFRPGTFKRPVLTDAGGKTYNTAVSLVDVGKVPEFTCAIPFRVPTGTKAKSIQIEDAAIDLTGLDR